MADRGYVHPSVEHCICGPRYRCAPNQVVLILPWPPTTNNLYTTVRGHRVKSARGRAYSVAVGVLVARQASPWPLTPPYRLTATLHAPGGTGRYDVANREKAMVDSIFRAIGQDDSLIDDLRLLRGPVDRVNPRAVVEIEGIQNMGKVR